MKNIVKALFLSTIIITAGCNEFYDINTSPNNPADASIDLVLPAAQASVAVTFGGSYHNLGGFWAQYYTQSPDAGQYENIDEYNVLPDFFDGEWGEIYAGGLNDLEVIRQKATESEDHSYYLIATLMQAYTFQMLADLYGEIPFSEALKGADEVQNLNPGFDNGADIYPELLNMIDEAVKRYEDATVAGEDPGESDLIYGGDMNSWIQFANTLKLKMYIRMAYTSSADAGAVNELLTDGNFITSDATVSQFGAEEGKRNPFYEIQLDRLGGVNQRASNSMLKYLVKNADPRIDGIYVPGASGHQAKEQGDFATRDISADDLSSINIGETAPVYLMSLAEKDFLVAEAEVRYNAGANAQAAYESGIENSFAMNGVAGASALYGAGGPYEWQATGTVETDIEQIMMQKWVALANFQNLEAFFEINRTHIPPFSTAAKGTPGDTATLTVSYASVLPAGNTPKRLFIPDVEIQRNSSVGGQTEGSSLATKVWWDQK